jgi:hypothetical protein
MACCLLSLDCRSVRYYFKVRNERNVNMSKGVPQHSTTIHFGFAHFIPYELVNSTNIRDIEVQLDRNGIEITGKNIQPDNNIQLQCKYTAIEKGDTIFTLKFAKTGEVPGVIHEPICGVAVIIGESGVHRELGAIYNQCLSAIDQVFPLPMVVMKKEATIKQLHGIIADRPSFQYLWEEILKQSEAKIASFGKPVLGGGLRVVVAPRPIDELNGEIVSVEYKIESFLQDPRYLYVENVYTWPIPKQYKERNELFESTKSSSNFIIEDTQTVVGKFFSGGN